MAVRKEHVEELYNIIKRFVRQGDSWLNGFLVELSNCEAYNRNKQFRETINRLVDLGEDKTVFQGTCFLKECFS